MREHESRRVSCGFAEHATPNPSPDRALVVGAVGLALLLGAVVVSQTSHVVSNPTGVADHPIENSDGGRGLGSIDESEKEPGSREEPAVSQAGSGTVPVTGVVRCNGTPVAGAKVTLHGRYIAAGITDAEGEFTLTTFELNDGALPGKYVVTITADGLPDRYADRRTSRLTATIKDLPGKNRIQFLLDD